MADDGDLVVCLGAGNISAWANELPKDLKALFGDEQEVANDAR